MKAPKFPSYDEAVRRKMDNNKKNERLLSKQEWEVIYEEKKKKDREKHKKSDKNRVKKATIAFRTTEQDREIIFRKIALSGLNRQDYMTNAILNAPIRVFVTKNVIDICKNELEKILIELSRIQNYEDLDESYKEELLFITKVIEAATKEKSL